MMKMKNITFLAIVILLISCNRSKKIQQSQHFSEAEVIMNTEEKQKNTWVFIMAGQSNMAGRGLIEPQDTIPSERILTINKNGQIVIAKEPLHFYEPSMAGLDCGLSFGKSLLKNIPDSITILMLPTAIGGSSISQWLGDSTYRNVRLLSNFIEKVNLGKKYGVIKGILWHQGESDANENNASLYKVRLQKLIEKFREVVGINNLPVLIGELGSYSDNNNYWSLINKQIESYASTDNNAYVIKTNDLKDKGDKVHFNSIGQRLLGQRFAKAFLGIKN